tara:strand:- start:663 stop:1253 length:591 start_codon:yes stop_codon:yes gene_type:complete
LFLKIKLNIKINKRLNTMEDLKKSDNYDAPTLYLKDSNNDQLFCYLEQILKIDGNDYGLLTPVDTPVFLFKINNNDEFEHIERIEKDDLILKTADAVLQEHDLTLLRSSILLTVSGDLEEPNIDDIEESNNIHDEDENYQELINFYVNNQEYALAIPLDPFFLYGKISNDGALYIEEDELDKLLPIFESELEKIYS